jgi:hypothetical protein
MEVRSRGAALLGAGVLVLAASLSSTVLAVGQSVTLCHADHAATKPYEIVTTDIASDGLVQGGHADHGGDGVYYDGAKGDKFDWGDIIPPYSADTDDGPFLYPGLNWTAEGQAIFKNDCQLPVAVPTASLATVTDAPSASVPGVTPSFSQDVGAITQSPTETLGRSGVNGPADGAWLLIIGLGVLLASIVVLTPARSKGKR